ncbi:unnamed protein product [Mytilus coruscus]|uniref:Uncharacterized protein n=1 Tax=Mytilus coruscus TaxID=42192 RepID=A0A6J8C9L1_MYTCO|nr:unnamed protein product [Mytilus coruscus]
MDAYVKQLFPSDSYVLSKTHHFSRFESIILKHIKTIDLDGFDVYGGVFVSDEVVVFGGMTDESNGKIKGMNILNERNGDEYKFPTMVKRLAFDFKSESLFVWCSGSKLYRFKFDNVFNSELKIKDNNHRNGGICISDGILYVIVEKKLIKINLESVEQPLEMCFEINTDCTKLNGLEIDSKTNRLLYTSKQFEVVCTSWDGREIFKYKDECMKLTSSVSVHSEGMIFAGQLSGLIHLISEDRERRRTVLNSATN